MMRLYDVLCNVCDSVLLVPPVLSEDGSLIDHSGGGALPRHWAGGFVSAVAMRKSSVRR